MLHCSCRSLSYPMTDMLLDADHITHQVVEALEDQPDVFTGVARSNAFSRFLEQGWYEVLG